MDCNNTLEAYFAKYAKIYDPEANQAALAEKAEVEARKLAIAKLFPKSPPSRPMGW